MKEKFLPIMKSLITLQRKLSRLSLKRAKNQNCGFIRPYGGQVSHLLINLSSLTFLCCRYVHLKKVFC